MTTYTVIVINVATSESEAVTVEGDSIRDAALTAAETPYDLWSSGSAS